MSATFKNAKKKLSQTELRKIMNEHKNKIKPEKKVNSPLAKYNDLGELTCILCQSVVRSEAVWPIHLNSRQHRDKVEQAKKLKERTNNFTAAPKRPVTPPLEVPNKKLKGILKNASSRIDETSEVNVKGLPVNFFENGKSEESSLHRKNQHQNSANHANIQMESTDLIAGNDTTNTMEIPEGFFDDPKQDAKARNIDFKDPVEEEWEKFQKAIRDADNESAAIIAEDQEEATNERQIDEIEEQMKNWSRVLNLERKKTEVVVSAIKESVNDDTDDVTDEEDDVDEFLNWRSKRLFKH